MSIYPGFINELSDVLKNKMRFALIMDIIMDNGYKIPSHLAVVLQVKTVVLILDLF